MNARVTTTRTKFSRSLQTDRRRTRGAYATSFEAASNSDRQFGQNDLAQRDAGEEDCGGGREYELVRP